MVTESLPLVAAIIIGLLCLSAFFSASEIAVFSLERHRIAILRDADDPRGRILSRLREDPHRLLVTILVGNNVINISMASLATLVMVATFGPGSGVTIATAVMSVLILIFGEIAPKSYGVANAERTALWFARPLAVLQKLLYPIVVIFEWVSDRINAVTGSETVDRPELTRAELERLVSTGERVGAIGTGEREMVEGVFDLEDTSAREVMIPRPNVIAVPYDTPLDDIVGRCAEERLTRIPIYKGSLDNIVGVVDEYGGTVGIVTIDDILEGIVGEFVTVSEGPLMRPTDDGLVVNGEVTVGDINRFLDVDHPRHGEYETVAGLINARLGRLGEVGDIVEFPKRGITLTVSAIDRNRIRRVLVGRREPIAPAADEES